MLGSVAKPRQGEAAKRPALKNVNVSVPVPLPDEDARRRKDDGWRSETLARARKSAKKSAWRAKTASKKTTKRASSRSKRS
jgi:hypothetical protein